MRPPKARRAVSVLCWCRWYWGGLWQSLQGDGSGVAGGAHGLGWVTDMWGREGCALLCRVFQTCGHTDSEVHAP